MSGADFGRSPIKDAAGPNDFQHMLDVEKWATEIRFLKFEQTGSRYHFVELGEFRKYIARSTEVLGSYREIAKKVIDIFLPMSTKQAEVFATVYAAWNNLIIDGKEINDKSIVRAARDEWHDEKKKIPEREFLNAIRSIREKGLVPQGRGKRVGEKYLL